jgi:hypothetical protein
MSLTKGEQVTVLEKSIDGWWKGRRQDNNMGWFPSNYVEIIEQNENDAPEYSTAAMLEPRINEQENVVALYAFTITYNEISFLSKLFEKFFTFLACYFAIIPVFFCKWTRNTKLLSTSWSNLEVKCHLTLMYLFTLANIDYISYCLH